jgi:hypothetical protein
VAGGLVVCGVITLGRHGLSIRQLPDLKHPCQAGGLLYDFLTCDYRDRQKTDSAQQHGSTHGPLHVIRVYLPRHLYHEVHLRVVRSTPSTQEKVGEENLIGLGFGKLSLCYGPF